MKNLLLSGLFLLTPTLSSAHDGEHIMTMWYQDPYTVGFIAAGLVTLSLLGYGLLAKKKIFTTVPTVAFVVITAIGLISFNQNYSNQDAMLAVADLGAGQTVTLYKSPNCGCCTGHAKALEEAGFIVTIEETDNLDTIKQAQNIPAGGASCHTSIIGDYVVEGHVPLEAIEKLLTEKPDVAGIGLPGMPIGTPGMPGKKRAPYEVYQLSETGEMSPYVTI